MPQTPRRVRVLIAGGGASGVILAAHLLRDSGAAAEVTLIEKRPMLGRGVAYSTEQPDHLLNVTAPGMSAFQDDPDHFVRWLVARGELSPEEPNVFVPRRLYGAYLTDLADGLAKREAGSGRFRTVHATAVSAMSDGFAVTVELSDGTSVTGDVLVLATGHDEGSALAAGIAVRPGTPEDTPVPPDAPVLILGTRLSMIDAWLALRRAGHRGRVFTLSRRGLLPHIHLPTRTLAVEEDEIPFGAPISASLRWFRAQVSRIAAEGHDWRDLVHGLRPFNQRIWRGWSLGARRRFLRHARPWWDVHRHRVPPEIHDQLTAAVAAGELEVIAGRILGIEGEDGRLEVRVRRRGADAAETLRLARIYDCAGLARDASSSGNPLIRSLVEQGLISADPLRLGLEVTPDCVPVGQGGHASPGLFAIGPLTRGAFFEIEAVPDIRQQCASVAARILERQGV